MVLESIFFLGAIHDLIEEATTIRYFREVIYVKEPTIEEKIVAKASSAGVDPQLATSIAWCESNYIPTAKNPNSTASGVFQFVEGTWGDYCEGDVFDEDANIQCAIDLLSEGGEMHWKASMPCWSKLALNQ